MGNGTEPVELTVLCMVCDGDRILLQNRVNPNWHGVTFPGGHVEKGESFVAAVKREILEETGLTIHEPRLCGVKWFLNDDGSRYIVLLYKTDRFEGELVSSDEGEMIWIDRAELDNYNLVNDFREHLRVFDDESVSEFVYERSNDDWIPKLY